MFRHVRRTAVFGALATLACAGCQRDTVTQPRSAPALSADKKIDPQNDAGLRRIQQVVVIYLENHSFDNLYGEFPGANGLANSGATSTQVDGLGNP
jgi:phospholipase C